MSYREENDSVILTMSREDWASIIFALGIAAGHAIKEGRDLTQHLALLNRLNEGNPNFTPYPVGEQRETR